MDNSVGIRSSVGPPPGAESTGRRNQPRLMEFNMLRHEVEDGILVVDVDERAFQLVGQVSTR